LSRRREETFHYSSYGFNLLGVAVERATNSRFASAVRRTADAASPQRDDSRPPARRWHPLLRVTGARRAEPAPRIDLSDRYPSGGFLSTAEDLVRFAIGITNKSFLHSLSRRCCSYPSGIAPQSRPATAWLRGGKSPVGLVAGHIGNVVGGTAFSLSIPARA
jgi:CubicO group peptidase (beta-lactamase class C family)